MNHHHIASRAFSKRTLAKLAKIGVRVIGATFLPDANGSFLNGTTAYNIEDNETHRILRHFEVLKLAEKI